MLRNLGDDGIAKCAESVHSVGNPISHSTHVGFSAPVERAGAPLGHILRPTTVSRFGKRASFHTDSGVIVAAIALQLRGVGHDKDAVTAVRGADGGSRYAVPLRVIPARGQVGDDISESGRKEPWDVLQQDDSWSKYANESPDIGPQPPLIILGESAPCVADWLAWESCGDDIGTLNVVGQVCGVVVDGDTGPMGGKDSLAVGLALAEPRGAEVAGAFKSKVESSYA
jgi:hypothetical protein